MVMELTLGVSRILIFLSLYRKAKTDVATEIPQMETVTIQETKNF